MKTDCLTTSRKVDMELVVEKNYKMVFLFDRCSGITRDIQTDYLKVDQLEMQKDA